jgi:aryl-alcohol dehydrogenase-like predicted oxidoreductase
MQTRPYGKTGEELTIVGFGGILVMNEEPAEAKRMVSQAYERGIRYFDVAPSYGNAEERLGPALEPYRKDVFLACKTQKRNAEEAQAELDQSLRNLRTDHFDLYQLHAVTTMEDVDTITKPGGALEVFTRARDEGRVRYLGFSAHSEEAALALMERFDFDSVLFPVNWVTWYTGRFGPKVLETVHSKGMASLALKALAKRKWRDDEERTWPKSWYHPVDTYEEAEMALRFTLSRGVTAAVTPGHEQFLWWACDAAENYRPLTQEEEQELERRAKNLDPIFATV